MWAGVGSFDHLCCLPLCHPPLGLSRVCNLLPYQETISRPNKNKETNNKQKQGNKQQTKTRKQRTNKNKETKNKQKQERKSNTNVHYQRDDHITAMHISNKMHEMQRNVGWCNQRALWGPSEPQSKDTMHTMENIAQGNMSEIYHSRHLRWDGAPAGFTNWFVWSALSPQPSLEVFIKTFAGLYQG